MPRSLDDRYQELRGRVYLTGIQALVRLPIDQMRRDHASGLRSAAFISGYEGSPLGGYDLALQRVRPLLEQHNIHFVPGLNEDLAATAVLGSQTHRALGGARYDGVVGIWYGKGPGVDRSGDILRHANLAGTGPNCAALLLAGDDHLSKSSTIPHQSDFSFYNFGIPVFYPGNTQEILDFGLQAIALSRYSGAWVGMKMVTNVCDGGGTVEVDPAVPEIRLPLGYEKRWEARLAPPYTLALEAEVHLRRLEAVREFARLNPVNRWFGAAGEARLGIATAGKSYYDLMQAFADFGIREQDLSALGIRVAKFGLTFPLEPEFTGKFVSGLRTLLVIEEKRSFLELQLRELLYGARDRPVIVGKQGAGGEPLLPATGELSPEAISRVLARFLGATPEIERRLAMLDEIEAGGRLAIAPRHPSFCPGCPHNRSTRLLEGQIAGGGIGCHGMAVQFGEFSSGYAFLTHMGGDGVPWVGMAPFVERPHIFQNMGDGTYAHSGSLAIQACIAAGVNITFKILYNGAVAMTGGQSVTGALTVPDLARKLAAEGVRKTVVVSDEPDKYNGITLAAELRCRDELPDVLREMEQIRGVTVIIYDQQCAAEKRRLRTRGKLAEPRERLLIHQEVCEGCGDCVEKSSCVSLLPVETEYGRKMRIHQSSCNVDNSCLLGDCPSFLTVKLKPGTGLRRRELPQLPELEIPEPAYRTAAGDGYTMVAPGIGGTGVVTINALVATAAWLDGLCVITLDQTGLAQKGGAVVSSIILSEERRELAAKVGYGNADLLLGFDLLGAASTEVLKCANPARTTAVVNTAEIPTPAEIRGERNNGANAALRAINTSTRADRNLFLDATRLAEGLFGTHLAVNIFLLGAASQAGLVPVSLKSLEQAIRWNGVEAERNLLAFRWGRKYYCDADLVENVVGAPKAVSSGESLIERRAAELEQYQDRAYAESYRAFLAEVEAGRPELTETVARNLYKLMAYKDEYEVARLLTKSSIEAEIRGMWEAVELVSYNLHPPVLRALGWRRKVRLGAWFRPILRILARGKRLRGTPLDIFGRTAIRREERALIDWYRGLVRRCMALNDLGLARELAALPEQIRGYEQIKLANIRRVREQAAERIRLLESALSVVR